MFLLVLANFTVLYTAVLRFQFWDTEVAALVALWRTYLGIATCGDVIEHTSSWLSANFQIGANMSDLICAFRTCPHVRVCTLAVR